MKKFLYILIAVLGSMTMSSCLMNGFEELDTFDGNEITGIAGTYFRYIDTNETIAASGENKVVQVQLSTTDVVRDAEAHTISFAWSVPSNYTGPAVKASELVVIVGISTASVIEPIEGAPKFGVPGDWSKPNKYKVTAANGDTAIWTVTATAK